jgi:thioredoxin-dependent peroxiredoxin
VTLLNETFETRRLLCHECRMRLLSLPAISLAILSSVGCSKNSPPPGTDVGSTPSTSAMPQAARVAPDFAAKDGAGGTVRLQDLKGTTVVVYFYPKDETPGCTKEACAFRDSFAEYTKQNVKIVGVSQDSEASHAQFRNKYKLPFLLAADTDGSITKAYGVGSTMGMSARVSFLVDREGKIAQSWPDVDPGVHAQEVLAAAAKLPK